MGKRTTSSHTLSCKKGGTDIIINKNKVVVQRAEKYSDCSERPERRDETGCAPLSTISFNLIEH